jgi:riboflavin synthase
MFTGIIQNIGTIKAIDKKGDWRITIETSLDLSSAPPGASICCGGCCLTIIEKNVGWFVVEVSGETLSKTNLGRWQPGTRINLEPSLKLGDELGGHFVFGHVDAQATLKSIQPEGDSYRLIIQPPQALHRYIAPKGSVTLDGVSLTVNGVGPDFFDVNVIPHTWSHTTLGDKKPGDQFNIEIDMLARYVGRLMDKTVEQRAA